MKNSGPQCQLLAGLLLLLGGGIHAATLHVSPAGNDANPGSPNAPVATLARASILVQEARRRAPAEPVTVILAPGDYVLRQTWKLGAADSGSASAPVTWRGSAPGTVTITLARPLAPERLKAISDPVVRARLAPAAAGNVREMDWAEAGVTPAALGNYSREGLAPLLLFAADQRLPLARWPNGEFGYTTMKRVLHSGSFTANQPDGGTFEFREDRPLRWVQAVPEGVWLRGFWRVPWVAETLRVKSIDATGRTITFALSTANGIGSKYSPLENGTRVGDGKEAWYALNLPEEIDTPGEWCVDYPRRKLYVWPPTGAEQSGLRVAAADQPLLACSELAHVRFEALTFGFSLGDGVALTGGTAVRFAGCRFHQLGRRGLVVRGGTDHEIRSCDFDEIGLSALDVLGGDRATLTPARHQVRNNHIWRTALSGPMPAVVAGLDTKSQAIVGCVFAHNRVHDTSYGGITFAGNDNRFEYNEIYRVGLDGGDLGGFYTTGGWTSRGNVVRANFIHHAENANAVYMDDGSCGLRVEDNLIYRTESGLFIGGGSDNLAQNNLVIATTRAVHLDDRGIARKYVAEDPRLRTDLESVPYQRTPWRERYPELTGILQRNPEVPRGNVIADNTFIACGTAVRPSFAPESAGGFRIERNRTRPDAGLFRNPADLDFAPAEGAPADLPKVDLASYGLQPDEYRPVVPPRDLILLRTGDTKRKAFDSQQDVNAYPR